MKNIKEKFKNYGFWLSLSGAVVIFLQALGFKIEQPIIDSIVKGFCGVLVVLGIITKPKNDSNGSTNDSDDSVK